MVDQVNKLSFTWFRSVEHTWVWWSSFLWIVRWLIGQIQLSVGLFFGLVCYLGRVLSCQTCTLELGWSVDSELGLPSGVVWASLLIVSGLLVIIVRLLAASFWLLFLGLSLGLSNLHLLFSGQYSCYWAGQRARASLLSCSSSRSSTICVEAKFA